jgi:hypothetical protein
VKFVVGEAEFFSQARVFVYVLFPGRHVVFSSDSLDPYVGDARLNLRYWVS